MTLKNRAIRLSLKDKISAMLITPDSETGWASFNIYTRAQFDLAGSGAFTPVSPYVYLLDAYLPVVAERKDVQLPQVVVEIDVYRKRPLELGSRKGRYVSAQIHVFGQNRGQRDDIASYIMDYIGSAFSIKDYSASNPTGTEVDSAIIEDDATVEDVFTPRMDALSTGLLWGWTRLTLNFITKF